MKLKFRRKGQRGLTLLEIMVAIAVLTSTLVAFASVFPAAFKLNRQSQKSVQAAKHAAAVAEELRAMPVACNSSLIIGFSSGGKKHYLEEYSRNANELTNVLITKNLNNHYSGLTSVKELVADGFTLDCTDYGVSNSLPSIRFRHLGNGGNSDSRFWEIFVTVYWPETINGRRVVRSASLVSARTGNR